MQLRYDSDQKRLTHILRDEAWRPADRRERLGANRILTARGEARSFVFREGCVYGTCLCSAACDSVGGCPTCLNLPARLRIVYDTTGWRCCSVRDQGDRLVFKRPPPECPLRGSGATRRRRRFAWTPEQVCGLGYPTPLHTHTHIIQLKWFDDTTEGWSRKTIPFQSLVLQGEQKWGHRAPYLEVCAHLTLTLS